MRRILKASVWARNGVPADVWRFRGLFRFVLPTTSLLFMYFGAVGWDTGIRSVQQATSGTWQAWWSAGIVGAALFALVGVSFPKLWPVELVGLIVLIGLVVGYVALEAGPGLTIPPTTARAGLHVILILLMVWRVGDLGFVAWTRSREGRAA